MSASPLCSALVNNLKTKSSLLLNCGRNDVLVNSVRFRKPRWLPIAKSKEFYVRKPTPIIKEEAEELYMRYSKYRADVASIRLFLKEQLSQKDVNVIEQQEKDDAADLQLMMDQVNEWNSKVADQRQKRQEQDAEAEKERIGQVMANIQNERRQRTLIAEKNLKKNKAANFITAETLDEAIEVMLDSRSDYNYAVTRSGDVLPGEHPDLDNNKPPPRTKMSDIS